MYKLTLIENKGYDTKEIEHVLGKDLYDAFTRWYAGKTGFISQDGRFCVFVDDFELWCKLRTQAKERVKNGATS